jgi:glycosyltransferase involved in cell wall biosynthesis
MKIAIFTDTFVPDVNGVANTLSRYTDYLKENKIQYRVFAPKSASRDPFSSHVHSFTSLPFFLYPECRLALPNMLHVRDELQHFQPDIIHVATPSNMGLCGLHYAKKLHIPIVGSYHTDFDKYLAYYDLQLFRDILWKYLHWFHRPLKKIFVPSLDTKERLQKQGFTNLSIWPRGIDSAVFHADYNPDSIRRTYHISEKYILLYVGRISSEKDVMLLPEIAKNLPLHIKDNVHWLVVGDGPMKKELEDIAPANMTLTGFIQGKHLAQIYASSDLFVFPSASETFGNVVLESLACATPVIGANTGGVRTIVQHGLSGLLCAEKDVGEFTNAITSLLSQKETRMTMAENGFKFAQAQSWDSIFFNLLLEYEEVLEKDIFKEKELA